MPFNGIAFCMSMGWIEWAKGGRGKESVADRDRANRTESLLVMDDDYIHNTCLNILFVILIIIYIWSSVSALVIFLWKNGEAQRKRDETHSQNWIECIQSAQYTISTHKIFDSTNDERRQQKEIDLCWYTRRMLKHRATICNQCAQTMA